MIFWYLRHAFAYLFLSFTYFSTPSLKLTFRKARWRFTQQDLRSPTQSATRKQWYLRMYVRVHVLVLQLNTDGKTSYLVSQYNTPRERFNLIGLFSYGSRCAWHARHAWFVSEHQMGENYIIPKKYYAQCYAVCSIHYECFWVQANVQQFLKTALCHFQAVLPMMQLRSHSQHPYLIIHSAVTHKTPLHQAITMRDVRYMWPKPRIWPQTHSIIITAA